MHSITHGAFTDAGFLKSLGFTYTIVPDAEARMPETDVCSSVAQTHYCVGYYNTVGCGKGIHTLRCNYFLCSLSCKSCIIVFYKVFWNINTCYQFWNKTLTRGLFLMCYELNYGCAGLFEYVPHRTQ